LVVAAASSCGTLQIAPRGQSFQPVIVRLVDSSNPPNPVLGANIIFLSYVGRMPQNQSIVWAGEAGISQPGMPVILFKSQITAQTDTSELAAFQLSTDGVSGNVAVVGFAIAGNSGVQFAAQQWGP
jgi:hypothetical protein